MAEQQRPGAKAAYPRPPPFWKHFTSENLARLKAMENNPEDTEQPKQSMPIELRYLKPPPPAIQTYTIFNEVQTLSNTLPSLEDDQLFPNGPIHHGYYLLKTVKSLLLNFLELTTILAINPELSFPKLEDIKRLFLNAHHLINIYRPHQARETLILMMEEQLERGRREITECEQMKGKIEGFLRDVELRGKDSVEEDVEVGKVNNGQKMQRSDTDDTRRMWEKIHALDDG